MKYLIVLLLFVCTSAFQCSKDEFNIPDSECLRGKLVIKGPCANLVIKIIQGSFESLSVEKKWTDPMTNIVYENVFTVLNVCDFPGSIMESEEFYFYFIKQPDLTNCAVCLIYRPTPSVSKSISVRGSTCN